MMGAEISYKHISGLKYEFTVFVYRDCRGVPLSTPTATLRCATGTSSQSVAMTRTSIEDVTPFCAQSKAPCSPKNTRSSRGIEKHSFKATIDFNIAPYKTLMNCAGTGAIYFETGQCCRNSAITTGPASQNYYTYAMINPQRARVNSSPKIVGDPRSYLCCNQTANLAAGTGDYVDYDSLSYALADPLRARGQAISYTSPYSKKLPFTIYDPGKTGKTIPSATPPIGLYLDPQSGTMIFHPTKCNEVTVAVLEITEWRKDTNGKMQVIGLTRRDLQYWVETCPANNSPKITNTKSSYVLFPGLSCTSDQCFTFDTEDTPIKLPPPQPSPPQDTITFSVESLPPGATFELVDSSKAEPQGKLCWNAPDSLAGKDVLITLKVRDDACPLNATSKYTIRLTIGEADSLAKLKGQVFQDNNNNCQHDTSDKFEIARKVGVGNDVLKFTTNDSGRFDLCIPAGQRNIRLVPHPFFTDCLDTTLNIKKDSTYYFDFGSRIANGISGYVYLDKDSNCLRDAEDHALNQIIVKAEPGPYYASTDDNGFYVLKVPKGKYTLSTISKNWRSKCSLKDTINVAKDSNYRAKSMHLFSHRKDIKVSIGSRWGKRYRVARTQWFGVNISNNGTAVHRNFYVYLRYDTAFRITSSKMDSIAPGLLRYHVDSLHPDSTIYLSNSIYSKTLKIRDIVKFCATTDSATIKNDAFPDNNAHCINMLVVNSYDPNNKETYNDSIFTAVDRSLDYIINFQNTGNDTAYRVELRDTLPQSLDVESIEVMYSSHPQTFVLSGNVLNFYFEGINLPDSGTNLEASNGNVHFRIKVKEQIEKDILIGNSASIYFDYNAPILTNTQINHFKSPIEVTKISQTKLCAGDSLKIDYKTNYTPHVGNTFYFELSDANGEFGKAGPTSSVVAHDKSNSFSWLLPDTLKSGTNYRIRITSDTANGRCFEDFYSEKFEYQAAISGTITSDKSIYCLGDSPLIDLDQSADQTKLYVNNQLIESGLKTLWSLKPLTGADTIRVDFEKNGCVNSSNQMVMKVFANPQVAFQGLNTYCGSKKELVMVNKSAISSGSLTSMKWFTGDNNSYGGNPGVNDTLTHTYAAYGAYTVKLVVSSDKGCADSLEKKVDIASIPSISFKTSGVNYCENQSVEQEVQVANDFGKISGIQWLTGDGKIYGTDKLKHSYTKKGAYALQAKATSEYGCADSVVKTIVIEQAPPAVFEINQDSQCFKNNFFEFEYKGTASAIEWNLGDGTVGTTKVVQKNYAKAGEYRIELSTSSGNMCRDTGTRLVVVHEKIDTAVVRTGIVLSAKEEADQYQWIDCEHGSIEGATNKDYVVKQTGKYALVSSIGNCKDTSNCHYVELLNVLETDLGPLKIYPNPTSGRIGIELDKAYTGLRYSLYTAAGQLISEGELQNSNKIILDIEGPSGVYQLELRTKNGKRAVVKVVKE